MYNRHIGEGVISKAVGIVKAERAALQFSRAAAVRLCIQKNVIFMRSRMR